MTEADLLDSVLDLAQLLKWRRVHFRPAMVAKDGKLTYRTAVQGDGQGYPDLTMVHRKQKRLVYAECKSDKGRVSPEQKEWLDDLDSTGKAEVYLWRPKHWHSGEIERILKSHVFEGEVESEWR